MRINNTFSRWTFVKDWLILMGINATTCTADLTSVMNMSMNVKYILSFFISNATLGKGWKKKPCSSVSFSDMQLWSREGQRYFTLFSSWLRAGPIKPDIITVIPSLLILMQLPIYGIIMSNFFSHVESFVNKGDSALKENLLCDGGKKEKEKKRVK